MTALRGALAAVPGVRILLLVLLGLGCAAPLQAQEWVHTTRPGDNLWNLSQQFLQRGVADVRRLQQYNNIQRANAIRPGTRIRIPVAWLKAQPAPARIIEARGRIERIGGDPETAAIAAIDTLINSGERIVTGADSSALVEFADGSRMLIHADSEVAFDALSRFAADGMVDTRVRLRGGRTENFVRPVDGQKTRYEVGTPPAVAAVRGTEFRVAYDDAVDTARSEVTEGNVAVSSGDVTQEVPAGFGIVAEAGKPLPAARALLAPPQLDGLPTRVDRAPLAFTWPALAGAIGYRVQLLSGKDFARLVEDLEVGATAVSWPLPADGEYRFGVRGIDDVRLEGLAARHDFVVDALPVPPPTLPAPADARRIAGQSFDLAWTTAPKATAYDLQLAGAAGFDAPLLAQQRLSGTRYTPAQPLPAGVYQWRVAGVDRFGERGEFGPATEFRILAVPPAPAPNPPELGADQLTLSWSIDASADHYEVQLARDPQFTDAIHAGESESARLALPRPADGAYYFRVRTISDEDVSGPYSPAMAVTVDPYTPYWWFLLLLLPKLLI